VRTLVVGDVHGCADELAALLDRVQADRTVLVGDLFTKGPDPTGVWALIRERGLLTVLGNHDARVLDAATGRSGGADRGALRVVEALARDAGDALGWLASLPLWREEAGFTVVHAGLNPHGDLADTDRRTFLNVRRWPIDAPDAPHWHAIYRGARRIVFGHDAVGGLVHRHRAGQTWLVGLDTGCVYGGRLTGFVLEDDAFFDVPAARIYKRVDGLSPG